MGTNDLGAFFVASTGAAAALVGLLFVAVAVSPEKTVWLTAPLARRIEATFALTVLANAFFVSLAALVSRPVLGAMTIVWGMLGMVSTLHSGAQTLRGASGGPGRWQRIGVASLTIGFYAWEAWTGLGVLESPGGQDGWTPLIPILFFCYGSGLARAWRLLADGLPSKVTTADQSKGWRAGVILTSSDHVAHRSGRDPGRTQERFNSRAGGRSHRSPPPAARPQPAAAHLPTGGRPPGRRWAAPPRSGCAQRPRAVAPTPVILCPLEYPMQPITDNLTRVCTRSIAG